MAMASTIIDRMPILIPGVICALGKPKPVTLVSTVVIRKNAVKPLRLFAASSPKATTIPEPIPSRLMMTCNKVYACVDMPRIMMPPDDPTKFVHLFIFADAAAQARHGESDAVKRFEAIYSPELAGGDVIFTDYEMIAGKGEPQQRAA